MNDTQAQFYLDVIRVYTEKEVPDDLFRKLFATIFIDLSQTGPDELSLVHTELMEKAQLYFAEQEEFKRAQILKQARDAAFQVFEARDEHLSKLKEILKKAQEDDGETKNSTE